MENSVFKKEGAGGIIENSNELDELSLDLIDAGRPENFVSLIIDGDLDKTRQYYSNMGSSRLESSYTKEQIRWLKNKGLIDEEVASQALTNNANFEIQEKPNHSPSNIIVGTQKEKTIEKPTLEETVANLKSQIEVLIQNDKKQQEIIREQNELLKQLLSYTRVQTVVPENIRYNSDEEEQKITR